MENIEFEINSLVLANLNDHRPIYLFNQFKNNLNYKILPNLLTELDNIIKSTDTNNSLEILTLEDAILKLKKKDTFFYEENCENDQIIEISSSLSTVFMKYFNEIFNYISFFESKSSISKSLQNLSKINHLDRQELLTFQRAICIQKLKTHHYNLLTALFQSVFDIYKDINKDFLVKDNEEMIENNKYPEQTKSILFQNFQQINTSL